MSHHVLGSLPFPSFPIVLGDMDFTDFTGKEGDISLTYPIGNPATHLLLDDTLRTLAAPESRRMRLRPSLLMPT